MADTDRAGDGFSGLTYHDLWCAADSERFRNDVIARVRAQDADAAAASGETDRAARLRDIARASRRLSDIFHALAVTVGRIVESRTIRRELAEIAEAERRDSKQDEGV